MPKIKPISQKTPSSPPCGLKEKIELFATCRDDELASHLAAFTRWDYPKGDLHQWIAPLNRFDDIFDQAVKNHGFRENLKVQITPFSPEMKEVLCQIMRVTTLLFGNCSYRTIYGSAFYIYELLGSTDLDILENALRLVACFAARTAQRPDPTNNSFIIPKNRLWKFATGEGINSRQAPFPDLKSLLSSQVVIPPNWAGYHFHYYKRAQSGVLLASIPPRSASNTQISAIAPTPKSREPGESSQKGLDANAASETKGTEGWLRVHINPDAVIKRGVEPILQDFVSQYNIPKDDQSRLFVQILEAYYYSNTTRREQFLRCQLYAMSSLFNVCDSNTMEKQLYSARPEIIQQLVRLLHNDSGAGLALKTIVLKTLRTMARNSVFASNRRAEQSRFHQVLTALGSNLNHGILMTLLRENVILLQSQDPSVEEMHYSQALHRLFREFLESPQGASNLGFAGIIPLYVDILKLERKSVWNIVVTIADLLATLLPHQRHNQLLPLFMDADGLGVVIHVIKRHVDYNLTHAPEEEGLHHSALSFPEHQALHTFLNLLQKLIKTGHGERVRNVVDSEVIGSLREILNHLDLFGGYIGMLASKLLAIIIHNEPTSYAALHENGLPQAFLSMIAKNIPASSELITIIPNVFDAICINTQGKELFLQHNFEGFFRIFQSVEHCKAMTKGHCALDCGAGMDELLRHHPDLKDKFLESYIQMMRQVYEERIVDEPPAGPRIAELVDMTSGLTEDTKWLPCKLNPEEDLTKARLEEERNIPVLLHVRSMISFAEGFFSTAHWIKEFLKGEGHLLLLSVLNAPSIPYDFGETRDGYILRTLMVQFVDQNGPTIIPPLLGVVKDTLSELSTCTVSLPVKNITDPVNVDFDVSEFNRLLRLYSRLQSHLAILQSIYNQTTNMQGRPNVAYTTPFESEENLEMLASIGNVVRDFYWRGNQLMKAIPKKYREALPSDQYDGNGRRRSDKAELTDDGFLKKHGFPRRDPTFRNVEMLQYFVSFLPRKVLKSFAGLSNSLVNRSKLNEPTQRSIVIAVLDRISKIFLNLLRYDEAQQGGAMIDLHLYWYCTCNFIYCILNGGVDPGEPGFNKSLQTLLLSRFHQNGGLQAILDITQALAESFQPLDKDNPADNESRLTISATLQKIFALLYLFTTEPVISESPQSALLTNRERYKDQANYFLLSAFLIDTRAACIPVLTSLLALLNKFDKVTTQSLLSTLSDMVLIGPEEFQTDVNKYEGDPDEESIQRLVQQGFDRGNVYNALMANGNVEAAALEHLHSRRNALNPQPDDIMGALSPPFNAASLGRSSEQTTPDFPATFTQLIASPSEPNPMEPGIPDPSLDTHMDIDSPHLETDPLPTTIIKGKEAAETRAETLARLRTEFSNNLENYITDILVYHSDLPHELARLIKSVGKRESNEWIQDKMLELAARLASMEDDRATKAKEITACAHILGLLLGEKRYYEAAEAGIIGFLDSFVNFLSIEDGMESPWLASVTFVLEVVMRESEWRQWKKNQDVAQADQTIPTIESEFFDRLMDKLIDLLSSELCDETASICVVRLLVRLTRDGPYARIFREKNGVQSLLQLNHRHAGKSAINLSELSVIIIRQVVEDENIVLATMRSVIQAVLEAGASRSRNIDLGELLRNKFGEVLRNPTLFSHAVEQLAKLAGWSSTNPNNHKLSKKQSETTTVEGPKSDGATESKDIKPAPVTPETPKKSNLELSHSSGVVQILLSELLAHHADSATLSKKEEAPNVSNSSSSQRMENGQPVSNPSRTKLNPEESKDYAFTLFLLQTLSELLGSYNNCKLEFVNYSRRGQSREPLTPSKPRSLMLNYLLNDLLPTGSASYTAHGSQDLNFEKKRGISILAASVISSLCKKTPEFYEHDDRPDLLVNVRKFVLEGISRSFKETLSSTGPAQHRYSRYTSLAELCRRLLAAPASFMPQPIPPAEIAGSPEMAKLMFEKGFIGLLTNVVADIELDFPDVRGVINDVLGSLKDLAVSVNRLAMNSSLDVDGATGDIEEISTASSVSEEEEEMQDRDETPDVFRNSALGILQGVVDDDRHMDHNHNHHHLNFQEYDEEMDYDDDDDDEDDDDEDEESGSEEDEMDDDGNEVRAVEIIVDNEGDEDEDDSERSSDLSRDSDGMEDDHDEDDEEASEGNSIIDMLEEEQMEADQADEDDGWTTDTDSAEDNEEILEEEESNEEEFTGFPPRDFPILDHDADGMNFSEEDIDEGADIEGFREMIGNIEGEFLAPEPDEDEDEDEQDHLPHHHLNWLPVGRTHPIRPNGAHRHEFQFVPPDFRNNARGGLPPQRSFLPPAPVATSNIHPMMGGPSQPPQRPIRTVTRHLPQLSGAPPDLLRSMEHLFGMQNILNDLMEQLGDGHQTTISFELRSNANGPNVVPRIFRMRHQVPAGQPLSREESQYPLKMVSDFAILDTSTRWSQAATMWYLGIASERAAMFEQRIFKLLEPAAIEEEKIRKAKEEADREAARKAKEEEERRIAKEEAEAQAKAEAETREREEAEARAREEQRLAEEQAERERLAAEALIESSNALRAVAMDEIETNDSAPVSSNQAEQEDQLQAGVDVGQPPAESSSSQSIFTIIRGNRVDISGLGVDPEFLEALPEDMREEVLLQHIREQRAAAPTDQPSTLDPSFLEALPPDIRSELLEEEAAERRRQERSAQRQQGGQGASTGPADLDPASFIASLEGPLRQAVLLDQDDDILSQLPPHIVAEATALRERVGHRFGGPIFGHRHPLAAEIRRKPPTPKRKDGIQLLEKSGLATLIRLTFLRNRPEALQDILLELCRHRHTRIEVVGLLLTILQEGSTDVAAVERSFSQLSLKVKGQDQGSSPLKSKAKMDSSFISHISGENSPTLIARHCLELLNHLIKHNHSLPFYFLTEHESAPVLKRVNSKKGKGKEVVTRESRYPLNALLSLLERHTILDTKASAEEFARLLSDVTKPLLALQRKPALKSDDKPIEPSAPPTTDQNVTPGDALAVPELASDAQDAPVSAAAEDTAHPVASSSAVPQDAEKPTPARTLLPPAVSEHNLELLVLILVAKEVSRETFRATLATMHHLMAVPGALEVFGRSLAREAQRYADIARSDLWNISQKFRAAQETGGLKDIDLTEYTSRGGDQTKLLKIFKAIDYLFNRVQREDDEEQQKDDNQVSSSKGALAIYSQLSLDPLWENLSACLGYLRDNPDAWPLAQPLLSMIESLLVTCNHIDTGATGKSGAEHMGPLFFRFTEEHRKILNYLVHMQPSLMSGSFEILAHNPKVLEFDNKRNYFNRKLHDQKGQRIPLRSISLNIRRDMVFLDSFRSLCFRSGEEIKNARLNVRFQGEEGVDAGGLTREWYQVLARQMFDPNYALFTPVSSDSATFHPNKSSYVNDEHLMFFKFVGRIIGKALFDGRLLDCHFSRAVYKHILNRPISVKDLEYYDNTYYKNLMWMLENPINDIVTETFSIEAEEYGVTHIIDLVPEGRTIPVTDENKAEYVRLVSEYKLQTSVKDQLKEFLTGFHDVIPADLVSIFTEQELELLISGLPDIDIEDWKAHSTYSNYDASSPQIQWFWRAVRSFNKEERAKLLQFATGTSKVPLNGFKELEGMQGTTKFTIVRDFGHKNRLPQSHTCFNQIDLPEYDSYEQLRTALLTAITMGTEGFGFA